MSKIVNFEHDGKTYEVRIAQDGNMTRVRAFLDGRPVNGYEYTVDATTVIDSRIVDFPVDLVRQLVDTAINDVRQGYWEQYVAAVQGLHTRRI